MAGDGLACATRQTGGVYCWGSNRSGALAMPKRATHAVAVEIAGVSDAVEVGASESMACARSRSGKVRCWGAGCGWANDIPLGPVAPMDVIGVDGASALAVGEGAACAIDGVGDVKCWGCTGRQESPRKEHFTATRVEGISGANALGAGGRRMCARVDGRLWCFSLGATASEEARKPQVVEGLGGVESFSTDQGRLCAIAAGKRLCAKWTDGFGGKSARRHADVAPME